jgi:hypothetical protein
VQEAAAASRKLRLLNGTLRELVVAKARNDEEEEARVVKALGTQNDGIRDLLVRSLCWSDG